jgi:hypothetical protein
VQSIMHIVIIAAELISTFIYLRVCVDLITF